MGLSFKIAAGLRQSIHSRVRVPQDTRPYFTDSDSRLHILSPPTTRRATVEVFDPASTRECTNYYIITCIYSRELIFIELLSSNGPLSRLYYSYFQVSCYAGSSLKLLSELRRCNGSITDGRSLLSAPLICAQLP
jgi:hypothetical protein